MGKVQESLKRGELVDQSDLFLELETEREEKKDRIISLLEDIRQLLQQVVQEKDAE